MGGILHNLGIIFVPNSVMQFPDRQLEKRET